MSPLKQTVGATIQARFKGVPFLVYTETQDGGRKVAVHEYPGSDERFVEDLGKRPGIFKVRGYVGGTDWVQQSRRLTTALEESTEGILELSVLGSIKVKAQAFSKVLNHTALGRIDFDMTFLVTVNAPSPAITTGDAETTAAAAVNVLNVLQQVFALNFFVPTLASTAEVAEYDGVQLTTTVLDAVTALGQDTDEITSLANSVRNNISELVRDPVEYASKLFSDGFLGGVFDTIEISRDALTSLGDLTRAGYNLAQDFESIEDDALSNAEQSFVIPEFADDTRYRQDNNHNRVLVTNSVRTAVFVTYLHQATENDYATDSEINDVIADIEDVYENVILVNTTDPLVALALDQCRIEALSVLDDKIQTTPKVEDFELKTSTVDVELAYRLYAEEFADVEDLTNKADVLTDLNGLLPTRYVDTVKVLKV